MPLPDMPALPPPTITVMVNPDQRAAFFDAAERAGLSLSAWVRTRLLDVARREAREAAASDRAGVT